MVTNNNGTCSTKHLLMVQIRLSISPKSKNIPKPNPNPTPPRQRRRAYAPVMSGQNMTGTRYRCALIQLPFVALLAGHSSRTVAAWSVAMQTMASNAGRQCMKRARNVSLDHWHSRHGRYAASELVIESSSMPGPACSAWL